MSEKNSPCIHEPQDLEQHEGLEVDASSNDAVNDNNKSYEVDNMFFSRLPKKNLTDQQRKIIYCHLLSISDRGVLKLGSQKKTAERFNVSVKTVQRIWVLGKSGEGVNSRKKGHVGRKKAIVDLDLVRNLPSAKRMNMRSLSKATGIPLTTLWRRINESVSKPHSSSTEPHLTEDTQSVLP